MPLTPNSSAAAYLAAADLLAYHDWREVKDLVIDDGTTDLAEADVLSHPYVAAALGYASGRLEASLLRGQRYGVADLQALAGVSLAFVQGVLAAVAFHRLRCRRGADVRPLAEYEEAAAFLADLAEGKDVLSFAEAESAGVVASARLTPAQRGDLGLVADHPRFMPTRRPRRGWDPS